MDTIKDRLIILRTESGLSQRQLAERLNVSTSTYSRFETGEREPLTSHIKKIAAFYNVSCDYILAISDNRDLKCDNPIIANSNERSLIKKYRQLDTYGQKAVDTLIDIELDRCTEQSDADRSNLIQICYISAPVSAGFGDMLEDFENREKMYVTYTEESRKADFMLKVDGDSMRPKFNDGDYILIRKQPAVEVGQIGIFAHNGNGYVKKFGGDRLISLNPKYDDIMVNGDTICFGLVLGIADVVK